LAFNEISQQDLTTFLSLEEMNITSELELYEAATRWALHQVTKEGLKATPELIRQKIGPESIKSVRFLSMTNAEFSKININARILDFEEVLSIFLYMNSPGQVLIPQTLSSRSDKRTPLKTFRLQDFVFDNAESTGMSACRQRESYSPTNLLDIFTSSPILNPVSWKFSGVQIPKSIQNKANCQLIEHFDVLVYDYDDNLIQNFTYNQAPPCTTKRYIRHENGQTEEIVDDAVISFKFDQRFFIKDQNEKYRIQIVLHNTDWDYPRWIDGRDSYASRSGSEAYFHNSVSSSQTDFLGDCCYTYYTTTSQTSFVYAIIVY
jgi:hypothetical protein